MLQIIERGIPIDEGIEYKARQIEARVLDDDYFATNKRVVEEMVRLRVQGQDGMIFGRVFSTGIEGNMAALCLLPLTRDAVLKDVLSNGGSSSVQVTARDVVVGTPALVVVRDPKVSSSLSGNLTEDRPRFVESLFEHMGKVREGKALSTVRVGGWGADPSSLLGQAELQLGTTNKNGLPYEVALIPGLFGAMNTLNPVPLSTNTHSFDRLRLSMFPWQLEYALREFAKFTINSELDSTKEVSEFAKIFSNISGHSMAGYVLMAALRNGTGLELIQKMQAGGTKFVIEKPVLVGTKFPKKDMPGWMREVVESPGYAEHVPFMVGVMGQIIRAGINPLLESNDFIHSVRDFTLETPLVGRIFDQLLGPSAMFDGANILHSHKFGYRNYPNSHRLATRLLDMAAPIMGDRTIAQGLGEIYATFGDKDKILDHRGRGDNMGLGQQLLQYLDTAPDHIYWDRDGGHYPGQDELLWARL